MKLHLDASDLRTLYCSSHLTAIWTECVVYPTGTIVAIQLHPHTQSPVVSFISIELHAYICSLSPSFCVSPLYGYTWVYIHMCICLLLCTLCAVIIFLSTVLPSALDTASVLRPASSSCSIIGCWQWQYHGMAHKILREELNKWNYTCHYATTLLHFIYIP